MIDTRSVNGILSLLTNVKLDMFSHLDVDVLEAHITKTILRNKRLFIHATIEKHEFDRRRLVSIYLKSYASTGFLAGKYDLNLRALNEQLRRRRHLIRVAEGEESDPTTSYD